MTDLITIILLFIFAAAFFMAGYLVGKKKDIMVDIQEFERKILTKDNDSSEMFISKYEIQRNKELSLSDSVVNEPSGPIYRPTVKELNKMNEDEATKQAKEALKETFDNAGEPKI